MRIHAAGIIPILILLTGVLAILFLLNWVFPQQTIIHYVLYASGLVFMFFVVRFFRFPHRQPLQEEKAVYSGADGKVVAIEKVYTEEYFNADCLQVSVFMSIYNIHINWSPCKGKIVYKKHHPGKHLVAFSPKSSLVNEHTTMVVRDDKGREVMMRQIAGAVARRIIHKFDKGKELAPGEMIGMIKFGSRIDLLLPIDADIKVKIGDKVRGAQSLIARLK